MKLTCLFLIVFLSVSGATYAEHIPFWGAKAPVPYETPTQNLKPGEFTWAPQVAPEGPILVVISLDEQRAYAYRNAGRPEHSPEKVSALPGEEMQATS